jgi:hypothetical protein
MRVSHLSFSLFRSLLINCFFLSILRHSSKYSSRPISAFRTRSRIAQRNCFFRIHLCFYESPLSSFWYMGGKIRCMTQNVLRINPKVNDKKNLPRFVIWFDLYPTLCVFYPRVKARGYKTHNLLDKSYQITNHTGSYRYHYYSNLIRKFGSRRVDRRRS